MEIMAAERNCGRLSVEACLDDNDARDQEGDGVIVRPDDSPANELLVVGTELRPFWQSGAYNKLQPSF